MKDNSSLTIWLSYNPKIFELTKEPEFLRTDFNLNTIESNRLIGQGQLDYGDGRESVTPFVWDSTEVLGTEERKYGTTLETGDLHLSWTLNEDSSSHTVSNVLHTLMSDITDRTFLWEGTIETSSFEKAILDGYLPVHRPSTRFEVDYRSFFDSGNNCRMFLDLRRLLVLLNINLGRDQLGDYFGDGEQLWKERRTISWVIRTPKR